MEQIIKLIQKAYLFIKKSTSMKLDEVLSEKFFSKQKWRHIFNILLSVFSDLVSDSKPSQNTISS